MSCRLTRVVGEDPTESMFHDHEGCVGYMEVLLYVHSRYARCIGVPVPGNPHCLMWYMLLLYIGTRAQTRLLYHHLPLRLWNCMIMSCA
jgi:hypothetical protein